MHHLQKNMLNDDIKSIKQRLSILGTNREEVFNQEKRICALEKENHSLRKYLEKEMGYFNGVEPIGMTVRCMEVRLEHPTMSILLDETAPSVVRKATQFHTSQGGLCVLENKIKEMNDKIKEMDDKNVYLERQVEELKDDILPGIQHLIKNNSNSLTKKERELDDIRHVVSNCISAFATKESIDEIKSVTIVNKRNIIASFSQLLELILSLEKRTLLAEVLPGHAGSVGRTFLQDPTEISRIINKRRVNLKKHTYKMLNKEELKNKTLDELRDIAIEQEIPEEDIHDAIEGPDNKNSSENKINTSHDNIRELIINKRIGELVHPIDQYRYRRLIDNEDGCAFALRKHFHDYESENTGGFSWASAQHNTLYNIKKLSDNLESEEINRFPNSYNEGFTDVGGYDDY
jgi:hypothetical protein